MKLLTIYFLVSITSFGWISSQNLYSGKAQYEVVYKYTVNRSHLEKDQNKVRADVVKLVNEAEILVGKMVGKLVFNNRASIFFSPEGLPPPDMANGVANGITGADHRFYYHREDDILIIEDLTFGGKRQSIDDTEKFWNILPDKAVINGINCQKAEGIFKTPGFNDTVVEVWFAPDIPFPYGPIDVYGLPGLIVKYKRGVLEIKATQITRLTDKEVDLIIPDFGVIPNLSETVR